MIDFYLLNLPGINLHNIHLLYGKTWREELEGVVVKKEYCVARKREDKNARMMEVLKGR